MLKDEMLILCTDFDTVGKTTEANVTNVVDFGEATCVPGVNKRGAGYLNIQVTKTFAGGTAPAVKIKDSADNASFAQVAGTGTISLAGLAAGTFITIPLPRVRRFLSVAFTASATTTAGKFSAWLGDNATQH